MRFALPFFFLCAPLLAGCPEPPPDEPPDLGDVPADCATRPPAKITLRFGGYADTEQHLYVIRGFQGGEHLWVTATIENMGPLVLVEPEVRDATTNELLSEADLWYLEALDAEPGMEGPPVVSVEGVLDVSGDTIIGKEVRLAARVKDACPHTAVATLTGVVEGYEPNP